MGNTPPNETGDQGALGWSNRAFALAEVTLVFALVHVAYRAFKAFTSWGQAEVQSGLNFSPGLAMIAAALLLLAVHRRRPAEFGLTPRPFFTSINAAFFCLLCLMLTGALFLVCGMPLQCPVTTRMEAISFLCLSVGATCLVLWGLLRFGRLLDRTPHILSLALLLAIPLVPIITLAQRQAPGREYLTVLWVIVGAGIGEEIFFRGYIQSRLNQAFGRPWRFLGVDFGFGLIGAALLFGLIHVLNGVDYFGGTYHFMWAGGVATASCLFYGFLREKTGSVLAPAIVHACIDLAVRMPHLLGVSVP